jgi:hypothetical protein
MIDYLVLSQLEMTQKQNILAHFSPDTDNAAFPGMKEVIYEELGGV